MGQRPKIFMVIVLRPTGTFAFKVTPELLVRGIVQSTFTGLIGGLFPAIRAARLPIAAGLREL